MKLRSPEIVRVTPETAAERLVLEQLNVLPETLSPPHEQGVELGAGVGVTNGVGLGVGVGNPHSDVQQYWSESIPM